MRILNILLIVLCLSVSAFSHAANGYFETEVAGCEKNNGDQMTCASTAHSHNENASGSSNHPCGCICLYIILNDQKAEISFKKPKFVLGDAVYFSIGFLQRIERPPISVT
jgi:hypothetical protein